MTINSINNPSADISLKLTKLKDESIVKSDQLTSFAAIAESMGVDATSDEAVSGGLSAEAAELDAAMADVVSEAIQIDDAAFVAELMSQLTLGIGNKIDTLA